MNKKWRGFVVVVVVLAVSAVAGFAAWAGTGAEPALDCREVDGQEVCDTFGESDEGPGTTAPAQTTGEEQAEESEPQPQEQEQEQDDSVGQAPDTSDGAAPEESSGGDSADEPELDCREVDGQEVCDTFGESDEGPGTQ